MSSKMFGTNTTEMSKKLRAAIKAKLEELGVYVDEELPDYIMVMIANRKEKSQMKEDLMLFLGKNTSKFVEWLFDIFERLQSAGAALPAESSNAQQSKKKEQPVPTKKEKAKDEEAEKKYLKKERENEGKKSGAKDPDKYKEKEKEHEKEERKEKEKREAKVVESKKPPHQRTTSTSPSRDRSRLRKKSEAQSDIKDKDHVAGTGYHSEKKLLDDDNEAASNRETTSRPVGQKSADGVEKRKHSESSNSKRRIEERIQRRSPAHNVHSRTGGRIRVEDNSGSSHSSAHRKKDRSASPPLDSDEEERIAEEESRQELYKKKVLSTAILKMKQEEPVKTVSSKVIVKRKLPEKENSKAARGAQSLFLKAIKEAGRMTLRTGSQIAGYGGGSTSLKKPAEKAVKPAQEEEDADQQEEGIEIDDYIDMEDALVVMPSNGSFEEGRRKVEGTELGGREHDVEAPATSKQTGVKEAPLKGKSPKFFVTLKNANVGGVPRTSKAAEDFNVAEKSRKRRSGAEAVEETNVRAGAANAKKQRQTEMLVQAVGIPDDEEGSEPPRTLVVAHKTSTETRRSSTWDMQIPIEEDDSSDDDEAQIDAVLASAHTITVGFDEVPPTPSLTTPAFCVVDANYAAQRQNSSTGQAKSTTELVESPPIVNPADKLMERCKFWPNCRLEEGCVYIHPSKPCSNFPNCKFGDRCIYLHPPCKFDRHCTNPHCPYDHSSKMSSVSSVAPTAASTAPATTAPSAPVVAAPLNASINCKFGGKCANPNCLFKHPKLCRFGERCTNRNCFFRHVNALPTSAPKSATFDKYKWKATVPA